MILRFISKPVREIQVPGSAARLRTADTVGKRARDPLARSGSGMCVLIVDDQPIYLKLLRRQLETAGCTVLEATNGVEALAVLGRERVDAVISDILMPNMDGYRLCIEVRKSPDFGDLPFVLYTSTYDSPSDRKLAHSVGADAYIAKPAPIQTILSALHSARDRTQNQNGTGVAQNTAPDILKQYNQVLVRKLEEKNLELVHAEAGLRRAQSVAKLAHVITGPDGSFQSWSETLPQVAGVQPDALPRTTREWLQLVHPADRDLFRGKSIDAAAKRERIDFEYRLQRVDGTAIHISQTMEPLESADDQQGQLHWFNTLQDVTEQKRYRDEREKLVSKLDEAQNQVLQSEKLASLGQLAAGVAHEINNPVGFVNSNLGTLEKYVHDLFRLIDAYEKAEVPPRDMAVVTALKSEIELEFLKEDMPALLRESKEGMTRVTKIVQDLKDFSRSGAAQEWQWADLHKCLDSTLNVVWNEIKYKAVLIKDYGAIPQVECMSSQINQVLMNLLVNAAHAIVERGTIKLSSGTETGWVWIAVADSGCGIAPENLKRIFDPFFTTKPIGKGTGLGLSVSYSIIAKHGGRIEVESEPGKGTTFRVWLPIQQVKAA